MKSALGTVIIFFVLIECRANFTDPLMHRPFAKFRKFINSIFGAIEVNKILIDDFLCANDTHDKHFF